MSNLKNRRSGNSVNTSKLKFGRATPLCLPLVPRGCRRRSNCRGWSVRALSTPGNPFPAINSSSRRRRPRFPLLLCSAARRSHRRAAYVAPSYANEIASVLRFSVACSHRLGWPESPGATSSSPSPAGAPPPSTRRGHAVPDRLCLHQMYRCDQGELLNVILTLF